MPQVLTADRQKPPLQRQGRLPNWCPRPESNRHAFRRGIFLPLRLSPPAHTRCSWSGARLHHSLAAVGARRLLSTPSQTVAWAWLGVGSDAEASRAFADFDGLHFRRFPPKAQIVQVPCVYRFHHSGVARCAGNTYLHLLAPSWLLTVKPSYEATSWMLANRCHY